ncbi:MAG TPA: prepilin-type N-terminal cleavage/methylation domain-containing protein [Mycobacterium sp.]|nr:prepilin-type N-terminal cleavage/methylation domain-containing protein [Mycobacterium sp.]
MNARDENGFTLLEVIVSLAILGIVGVVVTQLLFVSLNTSGAVERRLSDSLDRQRVTAAFVRDVQRSEQIAVDVPSCGGGPAALVTLTWTDRGHLAEVSYLVSPDNELVRLARRSCVAGALVDERTVTEGLVAVTHQDCSPPHCTLRVAQESDAHFDVTASQRVGR